MYSYCKSARNENEAFSSYSWYKFIFYTVQIKVTTHCGLVTTYGDIELGKHWLGSWMVVQPHQAITWTNVDQSSAWSYGIPLRVIQREIRKTSVLVMSLSLKYNIIPQKYTDDLSAMLAFVGIWFLSGHLRLIHPYSVGCLIGSMSTIFKLLEKLYQCILMYGIPN